MPDLLLTRKAHSLASRNAVQGTTAAKAGLPFRAEPSRVVFDAFDVGQHCQEMVHLRNLTSLGQHIRYKCLSTGMALPSRGRYVPA